MSLMTEAEKTECIGRVIYQLDGVKVGSRETAPYEVVIDTNSLAQLLPRKASHELAVLIEDTNGNIIDRPEKLSMSFGADGGRHDTPPEAAQPPAKEDDNQSRPGAADADVDVSVLAAQLTIQISRKRGPALDPEFLDIIKSHLREFRDPALIARAQQYREINKAFHDLGLEPLLGYALAMSRSNFDPKMEGEGLGLWQIPSEIARSHGYLSQDEPDSALEDPKRSAAVVAEYMKELLTTFDAEDFPYAVACFGMSLKDAGHVRAQLASAPAGRGMLKAMREAGISDEQVERLARFYAAGIVGDNPQAFGLKGVRPLSSSSLYY